MSKKIDWSFLKTSIHDWSCPKRSINDWSCPKRSIKDWSCHKRSINDWTMHLCEEINPCHQKSIFLFIFFPRNESESNKKWIPRRNSLYFLQNRFLKHRKLVPDFDIHCLIFLKKDYYILIFFQKDQSKIIDWSFWKRSINDWIFYFWKT